MSEPLQPYATGDGPASWPYRWRLKADAPYEPPTWVEDAFYWEWYPESGAMGITQCYSPKSDRGVELEAGMGTYTPEPDARYFGPIPAPSALEPLPNA